MEAFSLLKYWRGSGGINSGGGGGGGGDSARTAGTTTIVAAVAHNAAETDDDVDDDGPFFDLEFAVPDEEDDAEVGDNETQNREQEGANCENESDEEEEDDEEEDEEEREFNFTLSSGSSNDRADPNLSLSPSDDLFFKGRLVPIEPSSLVFNPSEPNSKQQPQLFPVSLLKSATKFRVSMLGLKKSKTTANAAGQKTEPNGSVTSAPKKQQQEETQQKQEQPQSKSFTVKFKVEEVPIVSLFTRDSSRSASGNNKAPNKPTNVEESVSDEKRFSKDVMQKYLKKVKPLYVRVSRRYGEKLRFSGQLSPGAGAKAAPPGTAAAAQKPATEKAQAEPEASDQGLVANINNAKISQRLRVVCKHLGKSRSASSAAVAAAPTGPIVSKRRDDSLLQQQDGIQSAILHCKRSFNASRDSESSLLSRSVSDHSHEK
ncbi:hypothetical protein FH972_012260 [Carpinus fangiana]|uniref:Membrane-associated kinase regulator 2 n=1 Tax=Carpinus fangiana TaxID=176857 RepID=A0A5N6R392_9ROSI|nr:hypothetical protein FH972_012260 [Carpinus fangiana]